MSESGPVSARIIPSIDRLRQHAEVRTLDARYGAAAVTDALRAEAAALRASLTDGASHDAPDTPDAAATVVVTAASERLARRLDSRLVRVINATGVVVHTNLGRAPLGAAALARIASAAGYLSLELDLDTGRRGRRDVHAEGLLCRLTGSEAAVVVNNNAAATLLMLTALGQGRDVVVSRGELIEIGGGFRVPDIMRQSGAELREVGTTNRTRAADYAAAISPRTALLLRVHPSNFTIYGFTERPALTELAAIAHRHGVALVEDIGSGLIDARIIPGLDEPDVVSSLKAGVDLVAFSGDKLLGGPQCGILAGRRDLVDTIRRHPLMRALRVDKLTYAALEATLAAYLTDRAAAVPVVRMLTLTTAEIRVRADALGQRLTTGGWRITIVEGSSAVGGGAAPGSRLPTWLVAVDPQGLGADALLSAMRRLAPPVIARIDRDRVVLDLRTVDPDDDEPLGASLLALTKATASG